MSDKFQELDPQKQDSFMYVMNWHLNAEVARQNPGLPQQQQLAEHMVKALHSMPPPGQPPMAQPAKRSLDILQRKDRYHSQEWHKGLKDGCNGSCFKKENRWSAHYCCTHQMMKCQKMPVISSRRSKLDIDQDMDHDKENLDMAPDIKSHGHDNEMDTLHKMIGPDDGGDPMRKSYDLRRAG
jgi:hypothetical protein